MGTETTRAVSLFFRGRACGRSRFGSRSHGFGSRATRSGSWHTGLNVEGFDDRLRDVHGGPVPDHGAARPLLGRIQDHAIAVIARVLHDERSHNGEDFISYLALLGLEIFLRILRRAIETLLLGLDILYQFVTRCVI